MNTMGCRLTADPGALDPVVKVRILPSQYAGVVQQQNATLPK